MTSDRPMPDKSYLNRPLEISINTERRLRAIPPDRRASPARRQLDRSTAPAASRGNPVTTPDVDCRRKQG